MDAMPPPPPSAQELLAFTDPAKVKYDLVLPPALPPARPHTFKAPQPTKAQLASRAAEAEAIAASQRKHGKVPLAIRFLRLLESRSVQHNMTTPTMFHRVLKRRSSFPNKHVVSYRDLYPKLAVRLQAEQVGGSDITITVHWQPRFFTIPHVLNDCDTFWTCTLEDIILPEKAEQPDGHPPSDSESDEDENGAAAPGPLDEDNLVAFTRAQQEEAKQTVRESAAEAARAEALEAASQLPPPPSGGGGLFAGQKRAAEAQANELVEAAGEAAALEVDKTFPNDGAASQLVVPRSMLQARGCVHRISFRVHHRPSERECEASTLLRVSVKGTVWRVACEEFEPFTDEVSVAPDSDDENDTEGGSLGSYDEGGGGDDDAPDPFADVNATSEEDPFAKAERLAAEKAKKAKQREADAKVRKEKAMEKAAARQAQQELGGSIDWLGGGSNSTAGDASTANDDGFDDDGQGSLNADGSVSTDRSARSRQPGSPGGLVRNKFESDADWQARMTAEVDAATEKRKAAEKRAKEKHDFVLRTAEQSLSVFDDDARQVSGYTAQFIAQEDADMTLAQSKLENKWFGPQINELDGRASLNLSGKALERDDLDALAWILQRNWGMVSLDLSRCAIDDVELAKLLEALRLNTVLKKLNLRQTRLSDKGANLLLAALDRRTQGTCLRLTEIDFMNCRRMTRKAGKILHSWRDAVHTSLKVVNGLHLESLDANVLGDTLDLANQPLGVPEIEYLRLRVLARDGTGRMEDLTPATRTAAGAAGAAGADHSRPSTSASGRGAHGAEVQTPLPFPGKAGVMPKPPPPAIGTALAHVNLSQCNLSPESAVGLCSTLARVQKIQSLNLSGNAVYLEGALAVAKLVTHTPSLRIVRLAGCRLQWAPEMVEARAHERKGGGSRAAAANNKANAASGGGGGAGGGLGLSRDPAVDYDPTALFALADVAKRTRQLEECDLADEDATSVPGRQIKQSLAINRSIAYERHVDLVKKCVPPLKDPALAQRPYELTLQVDSKFLLREKLLHLNAAGVLFDLPPPPLDPLLEQQAQAEGNRSRSGSKDNETRSRSGSKDIGSKSTSRSRSRSRSSGRSKRAASTGNEKGNKSWFSNPLKALGLSTEPDESAKDAGKGANTGDFSLCGGSDAYYFH